MKVYVEQLKKLNVTFFSKMGSFHPPLNPKLEAKDLIIPSCRFMSSKKVPLLLWYNNNDAEAAPVSIIFKAGQFRRYVYFFSFRSASFLFLFVFLSSSRYVCFML